MCNISPTRNAASMLVLIETRDPAAPLKAMIEIHAQLIIQLSGTWQCLRYVKADMDVDYMLLMKI